MNNRQTSFLIGGMGLLLGGVYLAGGLVGLGMVAIILGMFTIGAVLASL